jgi:hypothetical protein
MTALDFIGVAGCCLLLAFAAYLPLHDRHPLDFLAGGALAVIALSAIAEIVGLKHILLSWFIVAGSAAAAAAAYKYCRRASQKAPEAPSVNSPV